MSVNTLDTLIWALIYAGLLVLGLGLAVLRNDAVLGWGLVAGGALLATLGVLLFWLRSRMGPEDAA